MADTKITVIGTVASRLQKLPIRDGQIIFVKDKKKVALDVDGKRTFYNEIITLDTDKQRQDLLAPINGCFYFVINTAVLWFYNDTWIRVTNPPQEVIFIGTTLPELGKTDVLYVDTTAEKECLSVWNDDTNSYVVVADKTHSMSIEYVSKLFD